MKKITLIPSLVMGALLSVSAFAADLVPMEKEGFLTTAGCAAAGAFTDCYLENYVCGSDGCFETTDAGVTTQVNVVLYSHNEGHTYKVDLTNVKMENVDSSINRNEVTIVGNYNESTNTIMATEVKPPPPPKKSFFKGCL
ncbi:MAG: hypothetical protein PHU40_10390 [Sulfurimonas sp.]|nr:hypothetical protein [Sulfurimonas sp.]